SPADRSGNGGGGGRRAGPQGQGAGEEALHRPRTGLLHDEDAGLEGDGPRHGRGPRAGGHGSGVADEERGSRRVLRGVQGRPGAEMERPMSDPDRTEATGEETQLAPRPAAPETPHLILNPAWLPPAVGFAHVVIPTPGLLLFLGGQAGHRPDGTLAGESLVD